MLLQFPGCKPAPPVGTLRWGDFLQFFRCGFSPLARGDALRWGLFLSDEKETKESLRAFPPKDLPGVPGWNCVKLILGPSLLLWLLGLLPPQVILATGPTTRQFPRPGLPWRSGVPAAVSQAPAAGNSCLTRVRPWYIEGRISIGASAAQRTTMPSM